eukprot:COSAG03_NODE_8438_length_803_cov_0.819602_2_plen_120_part_00
MHCQMMRLLFDGHTSDLASNFVVDREHGRTFLVPARHRHRRCHVVWQLYDELEARDVHMRVTRTAENPLLEVSLDWTLDSGQRVLAVGEVSRCRLDGERFPPWRGRLDPKQKPWDDETR